MFRIRCWAGPAHQTPSSSIYAANGGTDELAATRSRGRDMMRCVRILGIVLGAQVLASGLSAQEDGRPSFGVRFGLAHLGQYHQRCEADHVTAGFQLQYLSSWYVGLAMDSFIEPTKSCGQLLVSEVRNGRVVTYSDVRDPGTRYSIEGGVRHRVAGIVLSVGPSVGLWTGGSVWIGASGAVSILSEHVALRGEFGRDGVLWRSNDERLRKRIWDSLGSVTLVVRY